MPIETSKLKPFRTYNKIKLRKLTDREISWKPFAPREIPGGNYLVRPLRDNKKEFINSATLWQRGFPEIYGGTYDFLLYPGQYRDIFGTGKEFLKGEWFSFVIEHRDDLVGGCPAPYE